MDSNQNASEDDEACTCANVNIDCGSNREIVPTSVTDHKTENQAHNEAESEQVQTLSKRQQRKLKKEQNWLKYKPIKRAKDKEKKKQKRRDAIERGEELAPSRKKLKLNTMARSSCKVSVVIDCSFDSYMLEKDILKLAKQIQWCYSANRRAANPVQLHVCGIGGQIKSRLDSVGDYQNWDMHSSEKAYEDLFDKDRLVYLSSDSPNVLHDLDPSKVYIIGGLVDHNHHKGLCHQVAEGKGVAHAQLPISEHIEIKSRKVLTINHVFEILLSHTETEDWQKAFFTVLPQRKGIQLKATGTRDDQEATSSLQDISLSDEEDTSPQQDDGGTGEQEDQDITDRQRDISLSDEEVTSVRQDREATSPRQVDGDTGTLQDHSKSDKDNTDTALSDLEHDIVDQGSKGRHDT